MKRRLLPVLPASVTRTQQRGPRILAGIIVLATGALAAPTPPSIQASAKEPLRYTGTDQPDAAHFDGRLPHAVGVHRYQVFRANRTQPAEGGAFGWTYNHAPMLAYWQGRFWLQYLSDPKEEHAPPGRTLVLSSANGRDWTPPRVVFPEIQLPAFTPPARYFRDQQLSPIPAGMGAIMHQRMGWYVAPDGRLLTLGFYGYSPNVRWGPNRGQGIGRVVREVTADGAFGPIHFIRYNREAGWDEKNTPWFPSYKASTDAAFVAACDALLADKLMTLAWWEEDRQKDGFFTLDPGAEEPKGFSWFVRPDGVTVGVWKNHSALSPDGGRTWTPLATMPTLWDVNGKIWVQRTSDDRYALTHTQSATRRNRFPLVIMTGANGRDFDRMLLLHGEASPMRFQGANKNIGPQYIRGILPGNGRPPDSAMWITYSMNKEDMWVTRISVPVRGAVDREVNDTFEAIDPVAALADWNVHSPQWAPVRVAQDPLNPQNSCLELRDRDPWEYAKAERAFPAAARVAVEFRLLVAQPGAAALEVEVQGARGERPLRLKIGLETLSVDHLGAEFAPAPLTPGKWQAVRLEIDTSRGNYQCLIDGQSAFGDIALQHPIAKLQRIEFRSGAWRQDVPWPIQKGEPGSPGVYREDLPGADTSVAEALYYIDEVRTARLP